MLYSSMLNYAELQPGTHLKQYVRKYWIINNPQSLLTPANKYVLPNACFTLALISGAGVAISFPGGAQQLAAGEYLVGQLSQKTAIMILPGTQAIMVQFNPWAAALLCRIPFHELTDNVAHLIDVNPTLALALRGTGAFDHLHVVEHLERVLSNYLVPTAASAFVAGCFQLLSNASSIRPFKITNLAAYTGYTARGIEKKFKRHVGLSPKQTLSILKVRSVVNVLAMPGSSKSLTALAYRFGYADQSHFIKAYQQIMGSTPSGFIEEQYILPNP